MQEARPRKFRVLESVRRSGPLTKIVVGVTAVLLLLGLGWFIWFTVSPLFTNTTISEPLMAGAEATSPEGVSVLLEGSFVGADAFHRVSGTASVIDRGSDTVMRMEENFRSINGPDLHVWLVSGENYRDGYLDLGPLKGNVGAQNYLIPEGTDLSQYDRVVIWCVPFRQLFGSAVLG